MDLIFIYMYEKTKTLLHQISVVILPYVEFYYVCVSVLVFVCGHFEERTIECIYLVIKRKVINFFLRNVLKILIFYAVA